MVPPEGEDAAHRERPRPVLHEPAKAVEDADHDAVVIQAGFATARIAALQAGAEVAPDAVGARLFLSGLPLLAIRREPSTPDRERAPAESAAAPAAPRVGRVLRQDGRQASPTPSESESTWSGLGSADSCRTRRRPRRGRSALATAGQTSSRSLTPSPSPSPWGASPGRRWRHGPGAGQTRSHRPVSGWRRDEVVESWPGSGSSEYDIPPLTRSARSRLLRVAEGSAVGDRAGDSAIDAPLGRRVPEQGRGPEPSEVSGPLRGVRSLARLPPGRNPTRSAHRRRPGRDRRRPRRTSNMLLAGICHRRTVSRFPQIPSPSFANEERARVAGVAGPVLVGIRLVGVRDRRAVVAGAGPYPVSVRIFLTGVRHARTVVRASASSVAVRVVRRIERTGVASVSKAVAVRVFLTGVGVAGAVVADVADSVTVAVFLQAVPH